MYIYVFCHFFLSDKMIANSESTKYSQTHDWVQNKRYKSTLQKVQKCLQK